MNLGGVCWVMVYVAGGWESPCVGLSTDGAKERIEVVRMNDGPPIVQAVAAHPVSGDLQHALVRHGREAVRALRVLHWLPIQSVDCVKNAHGVRRQGLRFQAPPIVATASRLDARSAFRNAKSSGVLGSQLP